MSRLRPIVALLSSLLILSLPSFSRQATPGQVSEPQNQYENSSDGLRVQLLETLTAARDHNRAKLEALVKQMEIPDYEDWFIETYGKEKGESSAGPYGQDLAENQKHLESLFLDMVNEQGELEVRKVSSVPEQGMESAMISALQRPVDIFYAGWKKPPPRPPFSNDLIGYFVFLEGRFRWDSTIMPLKVQVVNSENPSPAVSNLDPQGKPVSPAAGNANSRIYRSGVGGVSYPSCLYCPDPKYTKEARAKHIEGTVVLQAVIQPNGRATDIVVVKSLDPDLTKMAIEAVNTWRFKPARGEDKEPVPVIIPIEVTFRLLN